MLGKTLKVREFQSIILVDTLNKISAHKQPFLSRSNLMHLPNQPDSFKFASYVSDAAIKEMKQPAE